MLRSVSSIFFGSAGFDPGLYILPSESVTIVVALPPDPIIVSISEPSSNTIVESPPVFVLASTTFLPVAIPTTALNILYGSPPD
jgi:hypothetical protein